MTTATHGGMPRLAPPVGVVTVDDQAVFRAAAHDVIDATPGFVALGEAASGQEALTLVCKLHPELVLIDLQMPGMDGIETARRMRRHYPRAVVVLISVHEPADLPTTIGVSGAVAFVKKQELRSSTLRALWSAHGR